MARQLIAGFETGSLTSDGTVTGSPSLESSIVRSGAFSVKIDPASGATERWLSSEPGFAPGWVRFYIRVTALPVGSLTPRGIFGRSAAGAFYLLLKSDGTLRFDYDFATIGTSTTALTDTTRWYRVELRVSTGTSVPVLRIDGTDEVTGTIGGTPNSQPDYIGCSDTVADTYTAYFDDIVWDNADFPGAGAVVMLKPTADSAGGTGWRLGTNAALGGNGFAAVDNTPPVGVADLAVGSDPKQIRNATSNANDSFDATMTTYSAAGVPAGATVNAVQPIIWTAAPVTTSAKQGTVGVVSNPAITNVALESGGTFYSGVNAGTWPTGWKQSHGTMTAGPSVTLGTAPVMRITQVTSSTRIAMVCFMGIYVDYTPAVAGATVPWRNPMTQLLAQ